MQKKKLEENSGKQYFQEMVTDVQYVESMESLMLTTLQIETTCQTEDMSLKMEYPCAQDVTSLQKSFIKENNVNKDFILTNCIQESVQIESQQKAPPHNFQGRSKRCTRCGLTKASLMKMMDMSPVTEKFIAGDCDLKKNISIEIDKQKPCLTENEATIRDIIL